jgi:Flp pilus assembly protein TadG
MDGEMTPTQRPTALPLANLPGRGRSRGQVLVIFAGAMILMMMMAAVVVDVSWYWVNSLRVQRAADAAALAGAVMLPDRVGDAYQLADEEATRNGYKASADVTVTPHQNKDDRRRLDVTIAAPVGTFFMRVIGIDAIPLTRTAQAEFTLPVPMGSPQNYYGVGFFEGTKGGKNVTLSVDDPVNNSPLASQGFWGAIFTSGGLRENGDRYAPAFLGNGVAGHAKGDANPDYDADGYDYTIEVGPSGEVRLFDPIFCATGDNGHGGSFGAGDHWTDHAPSQVVAPVGVTYRLYDAHGTPANKNDDGDPVAPALVYDPGTSTLGDFSGDFGTPQNDNDVNRKDCATDPAHNQWVTIASGLPAGTYRLNVDTSLDADNANVGAENLFSIWVGSASGTARVYGNGRMAAYTNLDAGDQTFYFAQIEKVHAGKTLEIQLFDPGESAGDAYLRFLDPDGDAYHYATFDWESDDGRSGTGVTSLQTSIGGQAQFNNHLVTISIDLGKTYGKFGLNPPGDITNEEGWWKIEYNIKAANDTTTWQVSIKGNPVHLLVN